MFDVMKIRERVQQRLAVLRRVDEATMHDLYTIAIREELQAARQNALRCSGQLADTVRARHPTSGWVMVDREAWAKAGASVDAFVASFNVEPLSALRTARKVG